jgi:hypothetical protein
VISELRAPGGATPRAAQETTYASTSVPHATPGPLTGQHQHTAGVAKAAAVSRYLHGLASLADTQLQFAANPAWVNA